MRTTALALAVFGQASRISSGQNHFSHVLN